MVHRYEAVLGFNTKQWWAYDNLKDEYCDPPQEVLNRIEQHSSEIDEQEAFFNELLEDEPAWLNDVNHRYKEIE